MNLLLPNQLWSKAHCDKLADDVRAACSMPDSEVILDCQALTLVNSYALRTFINAHRDCIHRRKTLVVQGLHGIPLSIVSALRLHRIMAVRE